MTKNKNTNPPHIYKQLKYMGYLAIIAFATACIKMIITSKTYMQ